MIRRVSSQFKVAPDSLHAARTFVRVILEAWGFGELTEPAALVTSELATEAVLHPGAGYRVTVEWDRPEIRIEVLESPSGSTAESDPPLLGDDRQRQVLERLAGRWGIRSQGPNRALWCTLGVPGPARLGTV